MLDRKLLLAHLNKKAEQYERHLLIASVLDGLRTAIERGDFDTRKEER